MPAIAAFDAPPSSRFVEAKSLPRHARLKTGTDVPALPDLPSIPRALLKVLVERKRSEWVHPLCGGGPHRPRVGGTSDWKLKEEPSRVTLPDPVSVEAMIERYATSATTNTTVAQNATPDFFRSSLIPDLLK